MRSLRTLSAKRLLLGAIWLCFVAACLSGWFRGDGQSAGPIPLAEHDVATAVKLVGQAIVVALMLTVPGLLLLRWLNAGRLPRWSIALVAGVACLLSAVLVSATSLALVGAVGCGWARYFFAAIAVATVILGRRAIAEFAARLFADKGWFEIAALVGISVMYLLLAALMAATPYPMTWTAGLADVPTFCRTAANFAEAGSLAEDYFMTVHVTGTAEYPATMAVVPITVTAACYWLFGLNAHSFFVVHLFAGVLMLAAAAAVATRGSRIGGIAGIAVFALLAAVPTVYSHIVMGSIGTLPGLGAIVLVGLWQERQAPGAAHKGRRYTRYASRTLAGKLPVAPGATCLFLVGAALPIMRPEGLLLAVSAFVLWLVITIARMRPVLARVALGAAAATAAFVGFCGALNHFPLADRHSGLLTLRYDPAGGQFRPTIDPIDRYRNRVEALLSGAPPKAPENAALGSEILAHPIAYTVYAVERLRGHLFATGQGLWRHYIGGTALLIALFAIAACRREQWGYLAAVVGYLTLLGVVNYLAGSRHWLCALVVLTVMAVRTVVLWARSIRISAPRARVALVTACIIIAPLFLHRARQTYWIRRAPENHVYEHLVSDFLRLAGRPRSVASSYAQLHSCMTGAFSVGGYLLVENLDGLVEEFHPDWILINNGRPEDSYDLYHARAHAPPGYRVALDNKARKYLILQKEIQVAGDPHRVALAESLRPFSSPWAAKPSGPEDCREPQPPDADECTMVRVR
jgi:hypothetical protein